MKNEIKAFTDAARRATLALDEASILYSKAVQAVADKYKVCIVTGIMSDVWKVWKVGKASKARRGKFEFEWEPKAMDNPVFQALAKLDAVGRDLRIGPSNMENYIPRKPKKVKRISASKPGAS